MRTRPTLLEKGLGLDRSHHARPRLVGKETENFAAELSVESVKLLSPLFQTEVNKAKLLISLWWLFDLAECTVAGRCY